MSSLNRYEFEVVGEFQLYTIVSVAVRNRNYFQRFHSTLNRISRHKLAVLLGRIGDEVGLELNNPEKLKYLATYGLWELKLNNPGFRLLMMQYGTLLILLNGFPKRSTKATKIIRNQYELGKKLRDLIKEDEDELKAALESILGRF